MPAMKPPAFVKFFTVAYAPHALRAALVLVALYIAVITAWVGDDAQITFRQAWNFIHGDGITFNYGERAQAFTHPAWFFLLTAFIAVTRELHLTTLVASIVLSVAAVGLLLAAERRLAASAGGGGLPLLSPALLLPFSLAFCDYMTSGLENPLSYFLVGLLAWLIAAAGLNDASRRRRWLFILLGVLVLNRPDYAALFLPLAAWLAVVSYRTRRLRGLLRDVWPGVSLLFAWFAFALIYFGSPLPNTFYAKLAADLSAAAMLENGVNYFRATLAVDPTSMIIIAAGLVLSLVSRRPVLWALAAGQLLYMGFILAAGGDFMQGRFFAVPVCLAVGQIILALSPSAPRLLRLRGPLVGGLVSAAVIVGAFKHYPSLVIADHRRPAGVARIIDERGQHYGNYGLLSPYRNWPRVATQSDTPPRRYNRSCSVGVRALTNPDIHLINTCALADPFLARLPAVRKDKPTPGHYRRKIPTNYGEYLIGRARTIPDEKLHGLLRDVGLAARAESLFTRDRFAAIWRLNTGHYADLDLEEYRDPGVHIPAVTADVRFTIPHSAVNGPARPDGARWRADVWRPGGAVDIPSRFYNRARVVLAAPRPATALRLSLSQMEDYEIRVNGELAATIDRVGPRRVFKNHTAPLPRPMMVETVDIRAMGRSANRAFSIGHLHLQLRPSATWPR